MLEVMLNATPRELSRIGGDFTYYRSLLAAESLEVRFVLLEDSWQRMLWWNYGRAYGKLYACGPARQVLPVELRQRLRLRYLCAPISAAFRERTPRVAYSHIFFPRFANGNPVPIVWSTQGLVPDYYAYWGSHRLEDAIYTFEALGQQAAALHVWTQYGAENLRRYCPRLRVPVVVVPPLVRVDPLSDVSRKRGQPVRFLFVGREAERKGLGDVLAAYERLAAKYPNIELVVVTRLTPGLRARLARLPRTQAYEGIPSHRLHQLMEEAAVLLVPTYADAYNLVLVEGMAKGCALLTSNLGALREVAPEGEVGFLVTPGDVAELVEKASALIEREDMRLRMAEAAIRRYQQFHSEAAVLPRLQEIFRGVARVRGREVE